MRDPEKTRERDLARSRRKRDVEAVTIDTRRLTKRAREIAALAERFEEEIAPVGDIRRPAVRAECVGAARPCLFVSCRWHMFLDVSPKTGAIKLNFPDLEPDELEKTCALDVADAGGETLEGVARLMNMTRERVRQLESYGLAKMRLPIFREFKA